MNIPDELKKLAHMAADPAQINDIQYVNPLSLLKNQRCK
jgi:hypothetical protein